jgi:hypothetical protein
MKRKLLVLTLTGLMMSTFGSAFAQNRGRVKPNLAPVPKVIARPNQIDIWTNWGNGALLRPGQAVDVFFETRRSAYVAVVNIDTKGRARLLFPTRRFDDGFVRGGHIVAIPERGAPYRLQVTGPRGVERIVAFASDVPIVDHWQELVDQEIYQTGVYRTSRRRPLGAMKVALKAELEGSSAEFAGRGTVQPQLVEVPVGPGYCGTSIFSAETWFEVGRREKRGHRRH